MAEVVSIDDLTPDPANTRTHPERNRQAMSASIRRFGPARSIVIDGKGIVRAGNGTIEEAKANGCQEVLIIDPEPGQLVAVRRKDWSPSEGTAYSISDNRSTDLSLNDDAALAATLRSLQSEDFDLAALGYSDEEVDALCAGLADEIAGALESADDPGAQTDKADELREKWGTALGQLWTIPSLTVPGKSHRLLCGDSTKAEAVARVMGGEKARLCVTSPPYNQQLQSQVNPTGMHSENSWFHRLDSAYADAMPEEDYQAWQVELLTLWFDLVVDGGSFFYNHKHRYRNRQPIIPLDWIRKTPWRFRQEIIWDRRGGVAANAEMFIPGDERFYWLEKEGPHVWNGVGNNRTTVWPISPQQNDGLHVCPYPIELVATPIECVSNPGDLIADPFLGSGTTIVAAEQTGRLCYGIELAPKYCAVVLERLAGMGLTPALS